ncbi:23 kDa integral membrane protein-like [Poecilia latipinna]|uniref:23 kDa integral membrane protein-like n=1 Tax=Poecilia formosa TaxID=48698 RepID=UPI000444006D|nr:PREDICTED: 23 kDa integral membrane protein-like [Poecilia formosa]XP_007577830.1 PREDICTED: 23 kDa integral membrane protein-like [Poecilia formosa]XP_014828552.1 PREDICTED: 23 kDa integral membrane protein-like [Poecilia mexicana]XP_014831371.1 PREDICTED: 23 kDa integral membrane protein-like [Poecilia mexicana]XP_014881306.1 PREDICTED: 23 kDa integral membrane protein-like [Poecilia latipinna]XP_014881445.1 PREDICTED: 23 kDa integral membrane protein-like [Poecilia latipinna]
MGKANSCLKLAFILLNVVFVVIGFVIIHVSVMASYSSYKVSGFNDLNLLKIWVFALVVVFIAVLGICAAVTENNIMLMIFAGLTIIMMIIYLFMGIIFTIFRKALIDDFSKPDEEMIERLLNETEIQEIQKTEKCCGVLRAEDWGKIIPPSCECTVKGPDAKLKCKPRPQGTTGPDQIFSEPCKDFFYLGITLIPTFCMSLFYGFLSIEILILALSCLLIHQIRRSNSGCTFT